jgi:hypothetical protein
MRLNLLREKISFEEQDEAIKKAKDEFLKQESK